MQVQNFTHEDVIDFYFNNHQVDLYKYKNNYHLGDCNSKEIFINKLSKRLSEVHHNKSKNAKQVSDWIVHCPDIFVGTEEEEKFFIFALEFFKKRYGFENVLSCFVHSEESRIHAHISVIPVCNTRLISEVFRDKNGNVVLNVKGKVKKVKKRVVCEEHISCSDVFTPLELSSIHKDFDAECALFFGIKGLILKNSKAQDFKSREEALKRKEQDFLERYNKLLLLESIAINTKKKAEKAERFYKNNYEEFERIVQETVLEVNKVSIKILKNIKCKGTKPGEIINAYDKYFIPELKSLTYLKKEGLSYDND